MEMDRYLTTTTQLNVFVAAEAVVLNNNHAKIQMQRKLSEFVQLRLKPIGRFRGAFRSSLIAHPQTSASSGLQESDALLKIGAFLGFGHEISTVSAMPLTSRCR